MTELLFGLEPIDGSNSGLRRHPLGGDDHDLTAILEDQLPHIVQNVVHLRIRQVVELNPARLSVDAAWQETGVSVALQLARATRDELDEVSRRLAGLVDSAEGLEARLSSEGALVELREQVHQGLFPSWTLSDGTLRIPVQATYDLAQAPEALTALAGEHTQGKLAIAVR